MTQIKDLSQNTSLVQTDYEIKDILNYCGLNKQSWTYLFIELDKSGADIIRVYGADNCNLDSTAYLIYTTRFNQK